MHQHYWKHCFSIVLSYAMDCCKLSISVIAQCHDATLRQLSTLSAEATRAHLSEATKSVATCNSLNNLCTLAANYLHCAAAAAVASDAGCLLRWAEQRSAHNTDGTQYCEHGPRGIITIGHGAFFSASYCFNPEKQFYI